MAFPGKYDFNYYKGDTLEFKIYPKTTAGLPFSLEGYSAEFNIATARGLASSQQIPAYAQPSPDNTYITCAITPSEGNQLEAGRTYVYDVEIRNMTATPYPLVYTLLNGNISLTEQVTHVVESVITIPEPVTSLGAIEGPAGTINVGWTAPTTGSTPTSYNIYGKAPTLGVLDYILITTVSHPTNVYSTSTVLGFPVQPSTEYFVKVTSANTAGENTTDIVETSIITAA